MSRLLLYRIKRLSFKPYIASIDEYCEYYGLYYGCSLSDHTDDATVKAKKCGRVDIVEKFSCFTFQEDYLFFDFLGRYIPYYQLPKHIFKIIKSNVSVSKDYAFGAFASKNIDNLLWISGVHDYLCNIVHYIEEYVFSKVYSYQVNCILRLAMKQPDTKTHEYHSHERIIKNLRIIYDKTQAKKIAKYLIQHKL